MRYILNRSARAVAACTVTVTALAACGSSSSGSVADTGTSSGSKGVAAAKTSRPTIPFSGPSVWLAVVQSGSIVRVSADGAKQTTLPAPGVGVVSYGDGALWALAASKLMVHKIDPSTNKIAKTISLRTAAGPSRKKIQSSSALDVGLGAIWAIAFGYSKLFRVDARTGTVRAFDLGAGCEPQDVAVAGRFVWLAMRSCAKRAEPSVYRFDPRSGKVAAPIRVGAERLDGTSDALLTASQGTYGNGSGAVIDPSANKALRLVSGSPTDVVITGHTVWWPIQRGISGVAVVSFTFADPRGAAPSAYPSLKRSASVELAGVRAITAGGGKIWATVDQQGIVPIDIASGKAGTQVPIKNAGYLFSGQLTFG